jgi:hypothetical protein
MGFLDKAKSQMAQATAMAKDAAQKGQAKLATMQAKKHADALLRDLGAIVYGEKTGRPSATATADTDRLMAALQAHEAQYGTIDLTLEAPQTMGGAAMNSTGVPTAAPAGAPASGGVPTSAPSAAPTSEPPSVPPATSTLPS